MQKVLDIGAGGAEWANNFGIMLLPYMQCFAHYRTRGVLSRSCSQRCGPLFSRHQSIVILSIPQITMAVLTRFIAWQQTFIT
jgi:hypothetical protein